MKSHRFSALTGLHQSFIVFVTFSSLSGGLATAQTNGTWNVNTPGNWSDTGNWLGGNVASDPTAIADFSTLDITGDHLVTINSPFTIGTLLSQDATTASNNWTLGGSGPLILDNGANQPVINVINQSLAISAPLDGINGFSKSGTGNLVLSGGGALTGNVIVSAGTVQLGADNGISTSAGINIFGGVSATRVLDLNDNNQTLSRFVFTPDNLSGYLTISGSGSSKLTIDATANTELGPGGAISGSTKEVIVDMSGLNEFVWNGSVNTFRVGMRFRNAADTANTSNSSTSITGNATVELASNNTITAATLAIGTTPASNNAGNSILRLGQTNALNANTINIGTSGRSNSTLEFNTGLTNPTATIRATDSTSRVTLLDVGRVANVSQTTAWAATADFSAGQLDALVTTLRIGRAEATTTSRIGTENGTFSMGKGILDVTTLIIGQYAGPNTSSINNTFNGNGTFNLNDAAGTVTAENIILADNIGLATGGTTRTTSGTFNLTAGTLEAKTIDKGADTGNATSTPRNFNFTSGTIRNYAGSNLAMANVPLNLTGSGPRTFEATPGQSITLATSTPVSGTGGFTKTGSGTLSLQGANTYTGATDVQAGTLAISNSFPNGSTFTVDAAATLELANVTLVGQPALDIDGTLNLTGPVRVGGPLTAIPGTLAGVLQYGSITGAANLNHNYRSAGFTVGATSADLNVAAGLALTWTGAGGNSWDLNTTVSWKDASNNPEKFLWADSVTFDSAGSGTPNVAMAAEMQASAVTVSESTVDYVFSGPGFISGPAGLTKDGAAKLTLATANSNTGTTTLNAGTLEIGSGGTTGWMGSGNIVNNASLVFNRSNNVTVANPISGTGSLTKLLGGTMTVTADNSYSGLTTISAGALHVGQQTTTGSLGTGDIVNNGTLRLNRADGTNPYAYTFANNISGTGALIVGQNIIGSSSFDSVVTVTGNNTFAGNVTVFSGGLKILNAAALGTGPKTVLLTNGSNGRSQLYLDGSGGNITLPAGISLRTSNADTNRPALGNLAGDNVINGTLTATSGGGNTLVKVIGGTLTLNGQIAAGTDTRTLLLAGTLGANGTINGKMTNGTDPWGLNVVGPNTWTLTNSTNDYTGNTTVNGGTLALGADNVLPDTTAVILGAGTLNAATFDDTVGTLDCTGAATINLGTGATLAFLDSSAVDWNGGTLTITGTFVPGNGVDPGVGTNPGSLRFGTTNGGLSVDQLASISAPGWTGFALDNYGYLTATVAAGYSSWAAVNGAGANLNDDHDNDGVDNGAEYFLGGPNGNTTGFTALPGVTNTGGILSVTWTKAGDYAGTYGNHFVVETSDSLGGTWTTETSPGNVAISGNNVTYTFPSPLGTKRFARLKVTGP